MRGLLEKSTCINQLSITLINWITKRRMTITLIQNPPKGYK